MGIAVPMYNHSIQQARERALHADLTTLDRLISSRYAGQAEGAAIAR